MTDRKKQEVCLIYYSSKITIYKARQSSYCIIGFADRGTKKKTSISQ